MIWVYVTDLMDRSRVASAVPDARFVRAPEALLEASADDTVVVDVSRPGVLDALPAITARRIIGYGSHVERDLLARAKAAGCTEVLPRSAFFSRLAELVDG